MLVGSRSKRGKFLSPRPNGQFPDLVFLGRSEVSTL
ncbi:hypothetical protein Pmani_017745 [Petrolisthes manimaculis]|uniref:Uncharacterized protein n=1 Tax=Petrolisthes manimaculis TaxID=1843537 RepID=A0AAE1U7G5_9EUCA|nr:hypothetical protein Pmani_017745 [Petrolisthes manimaculis]